MDWKLLFMVFGSVFIAELGDKTQLATLLFASDQAVSKWTVFIGASLALIATSAIGVLVGQALGNALNSKIVSLIAGSVFILMGGLIIVRG